MNLHLFKMEKYSPNYAHGFLVCLLLFYFFVFIMIKNENGVAPATMGMNSNSTHREVKSYLNLEESYILSRISVDVSSINTTPTAFLDILSQKFRNSTDEDPTSTVFPKVVAAAPVASGVKNNNGKSLMCFNITVEAKNDSNINEKYLKLISKLTRSGGTVTLCKANANNTLEDKVILELPTTLSIIIITCIYSTVSLFCALTCFISLTKFLLLFSFSNIFIFFLICSILTGSFFEVLMHYIPFHLNLMFFCVTGWLNLLSFRVILARLKFPTANHKVTQEVLVYFKYFLKLSVLVSFIIVPLIPLFGLYTQNILGHVIKNAYLELMIFLFPPAFFLLIASVMGRQAVIPLKQQIIDHLDANHYFNHNMFYFYNKAAMITWVCGYAIVYLSTYPVFWQGYLFMGIILPLSFLKDLLTVIQVKVLSDVVGDGAPVENV